MLISIDKWIDAMPAKLSAHTVQRNEMTLKLFFISPLRRAQEQIINIRSWIRQICMEKTSRFYLKQNAHFAINFRCVVHPKRIDGSQKTTTTARIMCDAQIGSRYFNGLTKLQTAKIMYLSWSLKICCFGSDRNISAIFVLVFSSFHRSETTKMNWKAKKLKQ